MKFAHMADCHIASWRDMHLRELNTAAFIRAVDICLERKVDFILISGDLFNTSIPPLDSLKTVVKEFKELNNSGIRVYVIAGSHDFSPSGKTMLDVLEEAGLVINVVKGTVVDKKLRLSFFTDQSGAKIAGMLGKRGMLEKSYYESLDYSSLENEPGFKIFMFHSAISELKTEEMEKMESLPVSLLPKNFDYYAGGHVHIIKSLSIEGYKNIVYPGPLFPNNFHELEELGHGGFYIFDDGNPEYVPLMLYNTFPIKINADHKNPEEVKQEIIHIIRTKEFVNTIVLIRIEGTLESGKTVDLKEVFELLTNKSAYFVMKNTHKLKSKEFEEIKVKMGTTDEIEEAIIKEHLGQVKGIENEYDVIKGLINALCQEKKDGEKAYQFEERIKRDAFRILGLP